MKSRTLKAVALVAAAIFLLTGCKDPAASKKVTVWSDGETNLGIQNSRKTMHAIDPSSSCKWTLMYDIPHTKKVAVVSSGGAKTAKKGVKMSGPGTITYKNPKTGKLVTIRTHPTTFYSENCGVWRN